MNQQQSIDLALERISAIRWHINGLRAKSNTALMQEYFRRAASWGKIMGMNNLTLWPFFDIPRHFFNSLQLDEDKMQFLNSKLGNKTNYLGRKVCELFLKWVVIQDTPQITQYALLAPYEPLIRIFERGRIFRRESSCIVFEGGDMVLIPRGEEHFRTLLRYPPLTELDDASLDQIDK